MTLDPSPLRIFDVLEEVCWSEEADIGTLLYISRSSETLFGMPRQELLAEPDLLTRVTHPDDVATVEQMIKSARSGQEIIDGQFRIQRKEDSTHWVRCHLVPLRNAEGQIIRLDGLITDITSQQLSDRGRERLLEDMEDRIRELGCLYAVASSVREIDEPESMFIDIASRIPLGMHHPNRTTARVIYDGQEFTESSFIPSAIQISSDIIVGGKHRGSLEIYLSPPTESSEADAFTREEQLLLVGIAQMVGQKMERLETEQALQYSRDRYRELFDNMQCGAAVFTATSDGNDFILDDLNTAALQIEQIARQDVVGRNFSEVFPRTIESGLLEAFKRVYHTGQPEHHPVSHFRDNRIIEGRENYVYKLPTGEIVVLYEDITKRSQAEEALRISEERFRTIVETVPNLLVITDADGAPIYISANCEEITGYQSHELTNSILTWVAEDDIPRLTAALDLTTKTGRGRREIEYKAITKTGRVWYAFSSWEQMKGPQGIITGIVFQTTDITEHKLAEQALRESESNLRSITETATSLITTVDSFGIVVDCNRQVGRVLGYAPEEIIGRPIHEIIHLDSKDLTEKPLKDMFTEGLPFNKECLMVRKDGRVIDAKIDGSGVRDATGHLVRTICFIDDITSQKHAQIALRESEEQYRTLFDNVGEALLVQQYTPEGTIGKYIAVNDAACKMFGYSRNEFMQLTHKDLEVTDDRINASNLLQQLLIDKQVSRNHNAITKGGHRLMLSTSFHLFNLQGEPTVLMVSVDLSKRMQTETALSKSQASLAEAQRMAHLGSWEGDLITDDVIWSDELHRLLGYDPISHTASWDDFWKAVHPQEKEFVEKAFERSKSEKLPCSFEFRLVRHDGEERIIHTQIITYFNQEGLPVKTLGCALDVTERKQAEEDLLTAHDELDKRVRERTEELHIEREMLKEKNLALKEVLNQIDDEKKRLALQIQSNVDRIVMPILDLLGEHSEPTMTSYISLLRSSLIDISSPFIRRLDTHISKLTPREIEVCNMIKNGFSSKQIASVFNNSVQTVIKQRKMIRKKLQIANRKINLASHLKSLEIDSEG